MNQTKINYWIFSWEHGELNAFPSDEHHIVMVQTKMDNNNQEMMNIVTYHIATF